MEQNKKEMEEMVKVYRFLKTLGKIALWAALWLWITFSLAATFGTI